LLTDWQQKLEAVLSVELQEDGSHDLGHCRRVWRLSSRIAAQLDEPADGLVLLPAAYLHDIVSFEKNDPRRPQASRFAAARADQILAELDFPAEKRVGVRHAIEAHSYSARIAPQTIEAKILQDADRMETLGAIGVARIFYVGGRIGTKLFHETDPRALHRPLDDLSYSLDHFYAKILRLPERMNTAPGRVIAQQRIEIVELFLQRLFEEMGAEEMSD
jgi:uncharacterized protein